MRRSADTATVVDTRIELEAVEAQARALAPAVARTAVAGAVLDLAGLVLPVGSWRQRPAATVPKQPSLPAG